MLQQIDADAATAGGIDPITVEVVRHTIGSIGDEMEANLTRTSFSPIVYESKDFCAALLDAQGQMIGQAFGSNTIFLCDLSHAIADILKIYGFDAIEPGDVFVSNDPTVFGQHLNNVVTALPIFFQGHVVAFVAVRVHWADIGGRDPGGWNADTTEIFQEGLQLPTMKLFKRGELDDELARLIALNIRIPEPVFGDMRAQVAACHLGSRRFLQLIESYGLQAVFDSIHTIWDQSEQRVRQAIAEIPDGSYSFAASLDDDGVREAIEVPLRVTVVVSGSDVTFDYREMPPQAAGPINSGAPAAMSVARIVVKTLTTPHEIANEGDFRPVKVILPEGTLISAKRPAPLAQWSPPLATLVDCGIAALSQAIPDRMPAGSRNDVGGIKLFAAPTGSRHWQLSQSCSGGWGAMPFRDGICGMKTVLHGDAKIIAAEIVEANYPVLIEEESLLQDSAGAGKFRGGPGTRRKLRPLEDMLGSFAMHRSNCPPWGLLGGKAGRADMFHFQIPGRESFSASKIENVSLPRDSSVIMETAGGGGWGDPLAREPELVASDVRRGYVSVEAAREIYGVVLQPHGKVDRQRTRCQRNHGGVNTGQSDSD